MSNVTDPKLLVLSDRDSKSIGYSERNNAVCRYLKNEGDMQFSVGDIVVKLEQKTKHGTDEKKWVPKTIQHGSPIVRRYVVIHKTEEGVPFIRSINADGTPGTSITCVADLNLDYFKLQLDSEYVDHMLLAQEGEHLELGGDWKEYDKKRREVYKLNKKILKPFRTYKLAEEFLASLKVGDKVFYQSNYNYSPNKANEYRFEVVSTTKTTVDKVYFGYGYGRDAEQAKKGKLQSMGEFTVIKLKKVNNNYNDTYEIRPDQISSELGSVYCRITDKLIHGVQSETE